MRGNAIKHQTTTTGTGALTLAAVSGWPTYASVFGNSGTRMVDYTVQTNAGLPIEGGVGEVNLATLVLTRAKVQWTWDGSSYDATAPTALSLAAGTHQVVCGPTVEIGGIYAASTTPGDSLGVATMAFCQNSTFEFMGNQRCEFFWTPIRRTGQISTVSLRMSSGYTGGTSSMKVGLYDIDEAGKPFNLLADFGNLGSVVVGTMTSAPLATPITVPPGDMYAIAVLGEWSGGSGSPSLTQGNGSLGHSPFGTRLSNSGIANRVITNIRVNTRTSLPADASGLTFVLSGNQSPFLVLG
jgi:hypothetical protein